MHFLGSGGSQRFSEITAGGGWVRTVWRDMTFDLKGRLGAGRPLAAAAGRLLTGAARVRSAAGPAAARFPHERWQFAWSYFLDTARPRLRCTRAEPDFEPRAWPPPASLAYLASVSRFLPLPSPLMADWRACFMWVPTPVPAALFVSRIQLVKMNRVLLKGLLNFKPISRFRDTIM